MELSQVIADVGVVVVLRADHYTEPAGIARTLVDAGLPAVEFTLTGANALDAIAAASTVDGAVVGAGSVLDVSAARRCTDAGAAFVVSPVTATEITVAQFALPIVLAGFSPTEVLAAWHHTGQTVKLFPASTGGPGHLKAVLSPLPEVPIMPSGGVDAGNVADYFAAGAAAVNVGSAVAPSTALETGDLDELRRRAEGLRAAVDAARG